MEIDHLPSALSEMHKDVEHRVSKNRERHIRQYKKFTDIITHNFEVGHFMLSRKSQYKGHKLSFKWTGPKHIVKLFGETVYNVANITSHMKATVKVSRILLYRTDMNGK